MGLARTRFGSFIGRNRSYLVGILLCVTLAPLVIWTAWLSMFENWADKHEALAAWVQAFGTIVALGIAVWVPWRIHLREQSIAAMPRQRKLLMLKDALGLMRGAIDYFLTIAAEFPDDSVKDANVEVVSDQMSKAIEIYLTAENDLPAVVETCAGELFEAVRDIELLQAATARHRAMLFAEAKGLRRFKRSAKVASICLQKVGDAFTEVDPLLGRAIERLV